MKKILSILLTALVAAGMTACGTEGEPSPEAEQQSSSQQTAAGDPQPSESGPQSRYLVIYFSYAENADLPEDADVEASASIQRWNGTLTGNTGVVAQMIAEAAGAEVFPLHTVELYPDTYEATIDQGEQERTNGARPELQAVPENLEDYDVIFLGYPNWWGDLPMAVYSFLDEVDLSGKTIVPFVTSGGSGLSGTPDTIAALEPGAEVREGLAVRNTNAADAQESVEVWLTDLGYLG